MFRVVPAAHAKPHAQQQIARHLELDYESFLTNVRGPPDKYRLHASAMTTLQQQGIYTYLVRTQNVPLHFPFDEIFRCLLFITVGRSVSA